MMSLKFRCIAVLAFLILDCYVLSSSARLNIQRGDRDIFDKPNCDSLAGGGCTCDNFNAFCIGTCERCQCSWDDTFISSNYSNGRCVENRRLLFIPTSPNSFSVKRIGLECMKPNSTYRVKKTNCDANDSEQRWIWTRNNQLMHVDSLRCLQEGPYSFTGDPSGYGYWYLVLKECTITETKQLWQCQGQNAIFRLRNSVLYMYMPRITTDIFGTDGIFDAALIKWQRWPSNENLCSKAFGCYEFVASAIFVTDVTTLGEREIAIPHSSGENTCFVMWDKLQYLDNDDWKQLPFRDEIFTIEKRNYTQTYLKLNYTKATNDWTGLIVKLQFYCTSRQSTQVNATNTKCVVIKFKGSRIYPPPVPPTVSTAYSHPTAPSQSTTPSQPTTSRTIEKPSPTKDTIPNATASPEKSQSDSSHVAIIVVCVVIAIMILCGVLGLFFYKRRRRSECKKRSNVPRVFHAYAVVNFANSAPSDDPDYVIPVSAANTKSPAESSALATLSGHGKRARNKGNEDKEVLDDPDYVIPAEKSSAFTTLSGHGKRARNRDNEDKEVLDDPDYVIPAEESSAFTTLSGHGKRARNRDNEDKEILDDSGYTLPNETNTASQNVPSTSTALPGQEKRCDDSDVKGDVILDECGYVITDMGNTESLEDESGYVIPDAKNTAPRQLQDVPSQNDLEQRLPTEDKNAQHDINDGVYEPLRERYDHVYQRLLPTKNP